MSAKLKKKRKYLCGNVLSMQHLLKYAKKLLFKRGEIIPCLRNYQYCSTKGQLPLCNFVADVTQLKTDIQHLCINSTLQQAKKKLMLDQPRTNVAYKEHLSNV